MTSRVRCATCGALLCDPITNECYLNMFTAEHGTCPTCTTIFYLPTIIAATKDEVTV